jgi:hypothetical protein
MLGLSKTPIINLELLIHNKFGVLKEKIRKIGIEKM